MPKDYLDCFFEWTHIKVCKEKDAEYIPVVIKEIINEHVKFELNEKKVKFNATHRANSKFYDIEFC